VTEKPRILVTLGDILKLFRKSAEFNIIGKEEKNGKIIK
jgi:hypothetical protein